MSEAPKITVEVCPETGMCSIVRSSGEKIDLMPEELAQLRRSTGEAQAKSVIAEVDPKFAEGLDAVALAHIRENVR
jgi:hypothetical protein